MLANPKNLVCFLVYLFFGICLELFFNCLFSFLFGLLIFVWLLGFFFTFFKFKFFKSVVSQMFVLQRLILNLRSGWLYISGITLDIHVLWVKGKLVLSLTLQGECLHRRHQCDLPRVFNPWTHRECIAQLFRHCIGSALAFSSLRRYGLWAYGCRKGHYFCNVCWAFHLRVREKAVLPLLGMDPPQPASEIFTSITKEAQDS